MRRYKTRARDKKPLIEWIVDALHECGCMVLHTPDPTEAPYRFVFTTPQGERVGIVVYAFLANNKVIKNRPRDEHRFQIKYGSDFSGLHKIWQDPFGLYTTLFLGINPEDGFFVAADPVVHNPTRFSVSVEFKQEHVDEILDSGWAAWERQKHEGGRRGASDQPVEVLVGGTAKNFLRLTKLERDAFGEDAGTRHWLAENQFHPKDALAGMPVTANLDDPNGLHALATEFMLDVHEVLDLIERTRMLKMAMRGAVAEEHLYRMVKELDKVEHCQRNDTGPDLQLEYAGAWLTIECKNVLRKMEKDGIPRLDFMKTRHSKTDPCRRFYRPKDFDLVAACLHNATSEWDFRFAPTSGLPPHKTCPGRITNRITVDASWETDLVPLLEAAAAAA